jgi:hypothetical protein
MKMRRRGAVAGTGVMFFVFFFLMLLIGGGIAGGVYSFFGAPYDFRYVESEALLGEVKKCLNKEGGFVGESDIFEKCKLNKNVLEGEHLILIKEVGGQRETVVGVRDYENQCKLKGDQFPKCAEGKVSVGGLEYRIMTGSNQQGRKILG